MKTDVKDDRSEDWREGLFDENTTWSAFKKSPGISATKFNYRIVFFSFWTSLITIFVVTITPNSDEIIKPQVLLPSLVDFSEIGLGFSAAILGFLIAGFAIFSAMTRVEIFVELAQIRHKNSDESELKNIFFTFINFFVHYIVFSAFCIFNIILFGSYSGIFWHLFDSYSVIRLFGWAFGVFGFVASVTWTTLLLVKLKSFLFNTYTAILLVISVAEDPDQDDS